MRILFITSFQVTKPELEHSDDGTNIMGNAAAKFNIPRERSLAKRNDEINLNLETKVVKGNYFGWYKHFITPSVVLWLPPS